RPTNRTPSRAPPRLDATTSAGEGTKQFCANPMLSHIYRHPGRCDSTRVSAGGASLLTELPRQRPTLPRSCPRSTIGPGGLNFRVRDGNGCGPSGIATGNRNGAANRFAATEHEDSRVQPDASPRSRWNEFNVVKPHGRLVPVS